MDPNKRPVLIASSLPASSAPVGNSQKQYTKWDGLPETLLLGWLETPNNYARWKSSGIVSESGRKKSSGATKVMISGQIVGYLEANGVFGRSAEAVQNKIESWEESHKKANAWLNNTGAGVSQNEQDRYIKDEVRGVCKPYDRLDRVMSERPGLVPTYVAGSTGNPDDARKIFSGDEESGAENGPNGTGENFDETLNLDDQPFDHDTTDEASEIEPTQMVFGTPPTGLETADKQPSGSAVAATLPTGPSVCTVELPGPGALASPPLGLRDTASRPLGPTLVSSQPPGPTLSPSQRTGRPKKTNEAGGMTSRPNTSGTCTNAANLLAKLAEGSNKERSKGGVASDTMSQMAADKNKFRAESLELRREKLQLAEKKMKLDHEAKMAELEIEKTKADTNQLLLQHLLRSLVNRTQDAPQE